MLLRAHPWCRGVIKQQHRHCSSNYTPQLQDSSAARQPHSTKTIICTQPPIIAQCWGWGWGCSDGVLFNHRVHLSPPLHTAALQHCSSVPGHTSGKWCLPTHGKTITTVQVMSTTGSIYLYKIMYTTCYILLHTWCCIFSSYKHKSL